MHSWRQDGTGVGAHGRRAWGGTGAWRRSHGATGWVGQCTGEEDTAAVWTRAYRHTERAGAKWMQDGTGRPAGLEETMAALGASQGMLKGWGRTNRMDGELYMQGIPEEEERERTGDRGMGRDDMMGMCREACECAGAAFT
ncbi:hypothetical protein B0H14DRAFT_2597490 [Mycena olivaceomarginata]|nr:hypothetical protein B0H14DRAFT_2597490 [Mycena olivaceomarginata]